MTERMFRLKGLLFVDALFANGFNATRAAEAAGYTGNNLTVRGARLLNDPDIAAEIAQRFAKLEAEDPRFNSSAILNEIATVAYMPAAKDTLGSKVRALELLGKWRALFTENVHLTINPVEQFLLRRHAARANGDPSQS